MMVDDNMMSMFENIHDLFEHVVLQLTKQMK